jgi:DNA-binding transcriptional LysR family regulator
MVLQSATLTQLRAFEAVGRHASFKNGAAELHVTQAALSHHVRHLEEELGVQLVRRLHQRIELTPQGLQLLADCSRGLQLLSNAVAQLKRAGNDEVVTVSVAPYFAARWLIPRLGRFWTQHPEIRLRLHHAYQPADFFREEVDAGISWGSGRWPGSQTRRVLTGELVPVCSPGYRKRFARDPSPADLLEHRLFYEFDLVHWQGWFKAAGVSGAAKLRATQIDDSHSLRQTVLDGHGVALFFLGLLQEDLKTGQLVRLFETSVEPGSAYYFARPKGRPMGPALTAFTRWLMNEVAANPYA